MAKKSKSKKAEAVMLGNGLLGRIQWNESYISLVVGILVVLFAAFFIITFSRGNKAKTTSEISSQKTENSESIEKAKNSKYYTVSQGESLWTISEKIYKTGFSWNQIADVNNIKDPFVVEPGQKLIIPKQESKFVAADQTTPEVKAESAAEENPSGNSQNKTYTVKAGEYLWDIAVREYGDGFRWVDIANANNVSGPDYIIFKNDVLKLP